MPADLSSHTLVIASIDRAGDHAGVLGVVLAVAVVGGLLYGLARLVARSRTRAVRRPGSDRRPDA
jgi:hypothetical protein